MKHPVIEGIGAAAYKPKCSLCGGTQVVNGIEPGTSAPCPQCCNQAINQSVGPAPRTTWTAALMCSNCAAKWPIEVPRGERLASGGDGVWVATFPPTPNERCPNCGNKFGIRQDWERQKEMANER